MIITPTTLKELIIDGETPQERFETKSIFEKLHDDYEIIGASRIWIAPQGKRGLVLGTYGPSNADITLKNTHSTNLRLLIASEAQIVLGIPEEERANEIDQYIIGLGMYSTDVVASGAKKTFIAGSYNDSFDNLPKLLEASQRRIVYTDHGSVRTISW